MVAGSRSRVLVLPRITRCLAMESRGDTMSEDIRSDTVIATGRRGTCNIGRLIRLHQMRIPKRAIPSAASGVVWAADPLTTASGRMTCPSGEGRAPGGGLALPISNLWVSGPQKYHRSSKFPYRLGSLLSSVPLVIAELKLREEHPRDATCLSLIPPISTYGELRERSLLHMLLI